LKSKNSLKPKNLKEYQENETGNFLGSSEDSPSSGESG
jgi:serine/threonine protein kinase